jgi:hypothetical protein
MPSPKERGIEMPLPKSGLADRACPAAEGARAVRHAPQPNVPSISSAYCAPSERKRADARTRGHTGE